MFAPELALVLALLRSPPEPDLAEALAGQVGDWALFLTLVRRHRVVSLVAGRLALPAVPEAVRSELLLAWRRRTATGLRQVAEAVRLTTLLEAGGVPCLVLKGAALSVRAYGQPTLRDGRDVDLLVAPDRLRRAEALLEGTGLRLEKPAAASPLGRALFRRYSHEYVLTSPSGVVVELKTRLQPTAALLPLPVAEVLERRIRVAVAGPLLPALADDDLLPYLCGHGARHCWFRLKWLADIAALVAESDPAGLVRLIDRATALGMAVPVLEALELCQDWLGCRLPEAIARRARTHPLVRRRRPMVEAAVLDRTGVPVAQPGLERMMERSEYLLRDDPGYRLAVLERHAMTRLQSVARQLYPARKPTAAG